MDTTVMRPSATFPPGLFWAEHIGKQLRTLGRDHQCLAMYLWTAPTSNQYGLFYLPLVQLCEEAGFTPAQAGKVLDGLSALEFAFYHRSEQWVWVKAAAQFSLMPTGKLLPRNDNRIKGIHTWYSSLRDNPYLAPFFDYYERMFFLPERRAWSTRHDETIEIHEQPRQLALVQAGGAGNRAGLPAATGQGSLLPDAPPGALVPVASRSRSVARPRGPEFDAGFVQWFSEYPAHRQVEKREAYKQWVLLRVTPEQLAQMLATLRRQKQTRDWIKEGGRYVPKPARYLEKGKHEDVVHEHRWISQEDTDRIGSSIEWATRGDPDDPSE